MIILKSFFRKKSTKIYSLILIVLFTVVFSLNSVINEINELYTDMFIKTTSVYIESKRDYNFLLQNNSNIKNIKRVLTINYNSIYGVDESKLLNYDTNSIIVYNANDRKIDLNDNCVILGLNSLDYRNLKSNIPNIKNSIGSFKYKDMNIDLEIIDIVDNGRFNEIIISNNLFDKIAIQQNYSYIFNVSQEKKLKDIYLDLRKKIDGNILILESKALNDEQLMDELKRTLKEFKTLNYIMLTVFIIVLIIINKNIISDLNNNINIEKNLGFDRFQIKLNILKRLFIIYLYTFVISIILQIPILKIINLAGIKFY